MTSSNLTIIFSNTFSARVESINWIWSKFFQGAHYTCPPSIGLQVAPGKRRGTVRFVGRYLLSNPGWLWRLGSRENFCWGQGSRWWNRNQFWESVVKSCWFKEEIWRWSFILWFTGFYTSQVIVWEFFHQQYESTKQKKQQFRNWNQILFSWAEVFVSNKEFQANCKQIKSNQLLLIL